MAQGTESDRKATAFLFFPLAQRCHPAWPQGPASHALRAQRTCTGEWTI